MLSNLFYVWKRGKREIIVNWFLEGVLGNPTRHRCLLNRDVNGQWVREEEEALRVGWVESRKRRAVPRNAGKKNNNHGLSLIHI